MYVPITSVVVLNVRVACRSEKSGSSCAITRWLYIASAVTRAAAPSGNVQSVPSFTETE